MARKDWPPDPAEIQHSIEEAIQQFVRKGWLVDLAKGNGLNGPDGMKSCGSRRSSARRCNEIHGSRCAVSV